MKGKGNQRRYTVSTSTAAVAATVTAVAYVLFHSLAVVSSATQTRRDDRGIYCISCLSSGSRGLVVNVYSSFAFILWDGKHIEKM